MHSSTTMRLCMSFALSSLRIGACEQRLGALHKSCIILSLTKRRPLLRISDMRTPISVKYSLLFMCTPFPHGIITTPTSKTPHMIHTPPVRSANYCHDPVKAKNRYKIDCNVTARWPLGCSGKAYFLFYMHTKPYNLTV